MPSKKPHSKSRLGCAECKRRHIRCDQVVPCCGPCARRGMECEYRYLHAVQDQIQILTQASFASSRKQPNTSSIFQSTVTTTADPLSTPTRHGSFTYDDMILMHHYAIHTSRTIGVLDEEDYHFVWETRVVQLAGQEQYLMHAILSIAAAHKSDFQICRSHYAKAIAIFIASEVDLADIRQAEAVLCYCVLVMLIHFVLECRGSQSGNDPVAGAYDFFGVMRTAVAMISTFQVDIFKHRTGVLLRHLETPPGIVAVPEQVKLSLDHLDSMINQQCHSSMSEIHVLQRATIDLRHFYTIVDLKPVNWGYVLQWPLAVSKDYLELLNQGQHAALAIFSHWCVALHHAPRKWITGDWAGRVIQAISEKLACTVWQAAIEWPLSQI